MDLALFFFLLLFSWLTKNRIGKSKARHYSQRFAVKDEAGDQVGNHSIARRSSRNSGQNTYLIACSHESIFLKNKNKKTKRGGRIGYGGRKIENTHHWDMSTPRPRWKIPQIPTRAVGNRLGKRSRETCWPRGRARLHTSSEAPWGICSWPGDRDRCIRYNDRRDWRLRFARHYCRSSTTVVVDKISGTLPADFFLFDFFDFFKHCK